MNKHIVEIWCGWDEGYKEFEFTDYDLKSELTIDGESICDRDKRIIANTLDKYKWHKTTKPNGEPNYPDNNGRRYKAYIVTDGEYYNVQYFNADTKQWENDDGRCFYWNESKILAYKEIEPFEEGE